MVETIIRFSLNNKIVVLAATFALIVWGIISITQLPLDAIPDITSNQVNVVTVSPNLAPLEMEQYISYPVELGLANIQGLKQTRSISQFGLSIVTLEFSEETDIYRARTQVNERLQLIAEDIPKGFGKPQLLPLTTGLGEVYQYVIRPKNASDTTYSLMALREIQDWIVKKQLLGTEGVAEISSFGGLVKQYHVRVSPEALRRLGISLPQVFSALERSNINTGASYIERAGQSLFIRGIGILTSPDALNNTFITSSGGLSVSLRQIATIETGFTPRFGALTNDVKEQVGGIVMMLKGENSRQVVINVKKRLEIIQKNLPKGLEIVPFIDREKLINATVSTVEKNLLEGGLIVIVVLFLILGNFRAGIIIASVIPLALFFAVGCMVAFGVSGNLMSLGALDFGLIIDGTVVIVENLLHRWQLKRGDAQWSNEFILTSAQEVTKVTVFGTIIITIVYVPLLILQGVEGKMFRPMALTVIFALIGALILSLTFVPVIAQIFLKPKGDSSKKNRSAIVFDVLNQRFQKLLSRLFKYKAIAFGVSLTLLIIGFFIFSRMGSQFIPQLDEGDYVVQINMSPGTSLSQMIETSKNVGTELKKQFPNEINSITGKIGSSEVPTDPMSVEEMDMILQMREKNVWQKVHTREDFELALDTVLKRIPGIVTSIQQPIAMRFNELMTGAKTDIIIKVLGSDLDVLSGVATDVKNKIGGVPGVSDLNIAKADGMPQLFINYNAEALVRYGLNADDVGRAIRLAFVGEKATVLFEGNRRYDVIVKLNVAADNKMSLLPEVTVTASNGSMIPLKNLADIQIKNAPAAVFRENSERSVRVNLNVRGRDIGGVVKDIQNIVAQQVKIPFGCRIDYGGQFENLQNASKRLTLVVPIALIGILLLLYLALKNIVDSLIIFSAIPFAIVGGILALALRGLPFSISAGVGFIALFGVAVLNGMVLISHFLEIGKTEQHTPESIIQGTSDRLRPVLMTAFVASLGFLPMAIATGAGAEVQRPLATVVIGGLITSTLLTLIILPMLYELFNRSKKLKVPPVNGATLLKILLPFILIFWGEIGVAQRRAIDENEAVDLALRSSPQLIKSNLQKGRSERLVQTVNLKQPAVFALQSPQYLMGPDNSTIWTDVSLQQTFPSKSLVQTKRDVFKQQIVVTEAENAITVSEIKFKARELYRTCVLNADIESILNAQDSLYSQFAIAAALEAEVGKISVLEKLNLEHLSVTAHQNYLVAKENLNIGRNLLALFLNQPDVQEKKMSYPRFDVFAASVDSSLLAQQKLDIEIKKLNDTQIVLQKKAIVPSWNVGVQQLILNRFIPPIVTAGINIPLWQKPYKALTEVAEIDAKIAEANLNSNNKALKFERQKALSELNAQQIRVDYFLEKELPVAEKIIASAKILKQSGEISAIDYLTSLKTAFEIRQNYIAALQELHQKQLKFIYFFPNN